MNEIDFKKEDDGWYTYKGSSYETFEDLLAIGLCNFCGCGCPDEALTYILNSLKHINNIKEKVWEEIITYEEWRKEEKLLFPITGSDYFMYYWLSEMEFTEHGGSIPGWVTDKGFELMKLIEEYLENEKEN